MIQNFDYITSFKSKSTLMALKSVSTHLFISKKMILFVGAMYVDIRGVQFLKKYLWGTFIPGGTFIRESRPFIY